MLHQCKKKACGILNSFDLRIIPSLMQSRKLQDNGWKPRWFERDGEDGPFRYIGGYWEAREEKKWDTCPDIFGVLSKEGKDR